MQREPNTNNDLSESVEVSPGVYYTHLQLANDTLIESAHTIEVDVSSRHINLQVLSPHGTVCRLSRLRDMVDHMEAHNHTHVVAAVNGDFFNRQGVPSGLQISEGEIITSPRVTKISMILRYDETVLLTEDVSLNAKLHVGREALEIDAINRTRKATDNDHLFLYNTRFGQSTEIPVGGVQVVMALTKPQTDQLKPKQPMQGKIRSISRTVNSTIQPGHIVLSATGEKAKWLETQLEKNVEVTIDIAFDQGVDEAKEVISGNTDLAHVLLKKGKINDYILDSGYPENLHRHPRTMLAVKDQKLHIIIIDGRQPGFSDGITFAEGARYLQDIGMEDAINIDGGGSTTCFVKPLGDDKTTLVNQPSDGFEREVGNALFIISSAPKGELERIIPVQGTALKMVTNTRKALEIKAHDTYMNALPLKAADISWDVTNGIGVINSQGYFQAGEKVKNGEIIAKKGQAIERISVQIMNQISQLHLSPERVIVEPNKTFDFVATAYDSKGQKIYMSPDLLNWHVQGDIGSINGSGCLQATSSFSSGTVTAAYNGVVAESHVRVGQKPEIIEDFEVLDHINVTHTGVLQNAVTLKQSGRPNPVRFGRYSGKVTYDFTGIQGTSKVTLNFQGGDTDSTNQIKGQPYRFGLWVYGDSKKHALYLDVADVNGETKSLEFTPNCIDWTGWKYVHADIPTAVSYPLSVLALSIVETDDTNKNNGALYFDDLEAEYMSRDEDLIGPVFSQYEPKDQTTVVKDEAVKVRIRIEDIESGVHAASVSMWINNRLVDCAYGASTGFATYTQPAKSLEPRNHIVVEAVDNAGNPSVPKAEWVFFSGTI